jgi:hypothetical protein
MLDLSTRQLPSREQLDVLVHEAAILLSETDALETILRGIDEMEDTNDRGEYANVLAWVSSMRDVTRMLDRTIEQAEKHARVLYESGVRGGALDAHYAAVTAQLRERIAGAEQ